VRRRFALALLLLGSLTTACGDGILLPGTVAGYYRLVTINGRPLPYISSPSQGTPVQVWRGDLVLRPNGTYLLGFGGNRALGFVAEGTYRVSGRELFLRLNGAPGTGDDAGQISGDSISLAGQDFSGQPFTLIYRRARLGPSAVASARYRLSSINGRAAEPLVVYDTTIGDTRFVATVLFDTVTFSDGVFFRRHRSESAIAYIGGQPSVASAEEWTTWGAYESGPGWVALLHYSPPSLSIPGRDSLSVAGDTLVRRTPLITGPLEERYTN
jgi:hypothetical protein